MRMLGFVLAVLVTSCWRDTAFVFRHEALHALRRDEHVGHDSVDFNVKCLAYVWSGPPVQ